MNTKGQIEAAICQAVSQWEQQCLGRGPDNVQAYLMGDLLLVRLQGVLTEEDKRLTAADSSEDGRRLFKRVRTQLFEHGRHTMEQCVEEATGVKVSNLYYDISAAANEEMLVFSLVAAPQYRTRQTCSHSTR